MILNASELREKDVINTCGGRRLGFICDYQIDVDCGKICAIFVTDQLFGMFCCKNALKIPWDKIICIGEDAVLVQVPEEFRCEPCEEKKGKRKKGGGWLF
ncbi:MAG: YlmC/YmxH family sporulation protein [Eubacteriales bacterium]